MYHILKTINKASLHIPNDKLTKDFNKVIKIFYVGIYYGYMLGH